MGALACNPLCCGVVSRPLPPLEVMSMRNVLMVLALVLTGCAKANVMPLSANSVLVAVDAAPACGAAGAQRVAFQHAAVATIRYGFDGFIVDSVQSGSQVAGAYQAPSTATTVGDVTTVNPGFITLLNRPNYTLAITMFQASDASGANALDARAVLGRDWREIVEAGGPTRC